MDSNEENEYRNKLNVCAQSLADKMAILEARDRLLRLKRLRQTDLATAIAVVGTCPDMCPELERCFREETNQVSIYEMDDITGRPDEYRMIKEYRRSGADQEEPLPHELRPTHVLNRTMDYLCTNIMDALDLNQSCGEWYDFVWSRTRSIRKDITQQHLCDQQVVSLTEKCARFHIHCSATLCQQNVKDFDPKINEENLSNCLQSLKDLYYDLSLRDIYCSNESEFRCYEILLHLNDTAILKDIQSYRQEIRHSFEVKIAIKAFFAFQSNNYIKFFKLLNECSYMMSCILHRYFNQMRQKAFEILRKCYTFNSSSGQEYPTQSLIDFLGFEDSDELKSFCDQIGLECDHRIVYLIRGQNQNNAIKVVRSLRLVENKRNTSVGQVINGSILPNNPYKTIEVHNSFDSDGRLKSEAIEAMDQKTKTLTQYSFSPKDIFSLNASEDKSSSIRFSSIDTNPLKGSVFGMSRELTFNLKSTSGTDQRLPRLPHKLLSNVSKSEDQRLIDELFEPICDQLIDEMVSDFVLSICSEQMQQIFERVFQQTICQIFSDIFLNTSDVMIRDICFDVIHNEIHLQTERKRIVELLSNEIFDDLIVSQIDSISKEVFLTTREQYNDRRNQLIAGLVLVDMTDDIIREIASRVHKNQIEIRESMVRLFREKRVKTLEFKYFFKWKNWFLKKRRIKHLKQSFPAAPKWGSIKSKGNSLFNYNLSDNCFDDIFEKSIERELMANNLLNFSINNTIKVIVSQVFESEVSSKSPVVQYFREKRIKRIQMKYFRKWSQFCSTKRLILRKSSFPAAPNWRSTPSVCSKTKLSFDLNSDIELSAKRLRREVNSTSIESNNDSNSASGVDSDVKSLFDSEMSESQAFSQRLRREIDCHKPLQPFNQTIGYKNNQIILNEVLSNEEEEEDIEVFESETDKMNRLKRLLSEEKDYFSLQNFVTYLSKNSSNNN